ncbi:MAG: sulfite exporter TauE/SafE family protein, partial [Desulfosporosinus sp.]
TQLKAQGTSLAILLPPVGILAFLEYYKKGNVDIKAGIIICITLLLGAMFGGKIAQNISPYVLKKGFGILLILVAVKMLIEKR